MHQIRPEHVDQYVLAGNCTLIIQSQKTGKQFTYKIRLKNGCYFVRILSVGYEYIGKLNPNLSLYTKKSVYDVHKVGIDSLTYALQKKTGVNFFHDGTCGKCGRKLTDIESINIGIGPTCRKGTHTTR